MSSDPLIGRTLAGFSVLEEIGRGGMGVVYLAEQASPKRRVALKVLSPALSHDPRFRERFSRESEAAAEIEHPNIVPIHAAGEAEGSLFIAMRYVAGTDLRELIVAGGPIRQERIVEIVSQVASALDAAHARGMVHRDVKPGNILLDASGHAYLTDFGLIKRNAVSTGITQTGQFMGSVDYCAPEQIKGGSIDGRADVYSLGCVLFECLTGQAPFPRDTDVAVIYAHLEDAPARPSDMRDVASGFDLVVERAMAKDPEDRYPTAGELAADMRHALGTPSGPPTRAEARAGRQQVRGGRGKAAALVAVVVALALGGVALLSGSDDAPEGRTGASGAASGSTAGASGPAAGPSTGSVAGLETGNGIVAVDPASGEIVAATDVALNNSGEPSVAAGEGGIWVHDISNVTHLDPASGELVATIPVGTGLGNPGNVAVGLRTVWVGNRRQVDRVNPATDELLKPITVAEEEAFRLLVAVGGGSAWALDGAGRLSRLSAEGRVEDTADIVSDGSGLAVGGGTVWVLDGLQGEVVPVDPGSLEAGEPIAVPGNGTKIAFLEDAVWVLDTAAGTVTSIDPATGSLGSPVRVGEESTDLAAGGGALWATDQGGDLWRVDPLTSSATAIEVGGPLAASVFDDATDLVWILVVDIR